VSEPYRKKLIEVALPLEAINRESARENYIYRGNPSAIHKWWAQRPLAACRAVLFASLVDDPSSHPEDFPTEASQEAERLRLFQIIEELVIWENSSNEQVLETARAEISKSTQGKPPPILDPFCGGGSIPLEAHRLGLEAHASDLNPVAVLITKALVEIPPRFAGRSPVNPESRASLAHGATWTGAQGLAADARYYGSWMRDRAWERIGRLYPKATLPEGGEANVIAWIWARTVRCPNPACGAEMPLIRSFALSTKKGKQTWAEPVIDGKTVQFAIRTGDGTRPEGTVGRRGARCIVCAASVPLEYVRAQGRAGRMSTQMLAIACEGPRGRIYLPSDAAALRMAASAKPPDDVPESELPERALGFRVQGYGMTKHRQLFTNRQLVALATLSDLVLEAREEVLRDGNDKAYADAVATYLSFMVDKVAQFNSALVAWYPREDRQQQTFARQTISMVWDFAEGNIFSDVGGGLLVAIRTVADALEAAPAVGVDALIMQRDAAAADWGNAGFLISTDPPYYDNVPYADLSDYFYVWLRRSLSSIYPDLFSTLLVPKVQELVADPHRLGGTQAARTFFEEGMRRTFGRLREVGDPRYPATVYYAFKQTEADADGSSIVSTGWETMLDGLISSGFALTGTWPMRSERAGRMRDLGSNALASSIILVCRPRSVDAPVTDRRAFVAALRAELPDALRKLQHGNIAPVDLAQAAIGPGMAIFSRHSRVVEATGEAMSVRTALGLINAALDEILAEQEGVFDSDTRFAIAWFEQYGMTEAAYGQADVLARAKNTSVGGLEHAGVLQAGHGKVRLLRRDELPHAWDPVADRRLTVWEVTQHLVRRLETGGELEASELLQRVGGFGETARELAYRLYTICERKGWAQDALGFNALVVSWPEIARLAREQESGQAQQTLGV
jgi:putative DNA methylase